MSYNDTNLFQQTTSTVSMFTRPTTELKIHSSLNIKSQLLLIHFHLLLGRYISYSIFTFSSCSYVFDGSLFFLGVIFIVYFANLQYWHRVAFSMFRHSTL